MRERLKAKPSELVCKYLFGPALQMDNKRSFENMLFANISHAFMLEKTDIISRFDASQIISIFLELWQKGNGDFSLAPEMEDYYFNIENYLISKIGIEVGGKLHTARSRNDLGACVTRMNVRDQMMRIYPLVIRLRSILLEKADRCDFVMTGYTHMQPAQPITFSYYLTAVTEAFERDYARMFAVYGRINICPLGSCAFAGTSFPIDRHYLAELLGFDAPIYNNMDAVASRDYVLEALATFAIFGSNVARFIQDIYIWTTDEFSYIEIDDSTAASSSIMPQKKNPITLEHCKAKVSHLLGAFVSSFSCMKGTHYGHSRDVAGEALLPFWQAAEQMEAILHLLSETVEKLIVKPEAMQKRADRNFCTVTELADEIVKKEGLSFRTAHKVVGNMVGDCVDKGLNASEITAELLKNSSKKYSSTPIELGEDELSVILDSAHSVSNKKGFGATSDKEVHSMIKKQRETLENDENRLQKTLDAVKEAKEKLLFEAQEVTKLI